ncbi:unnamed protein product [Pseudo-nitzschia multistriata]|uniref:Uncharacterized protein n=1 Tax=Pseudo-nitzschia multistriata TaxID=183589 RepID=A0A448Z322_9STRA|nr:unnamed protein product [Pseudo-nitzschia multistriata]
MSALPPAKLKAYLSDVKERFLDDSSPPKSLGDSFFGVLKMELLLRGVLVADEKKIWSQVQSSVGKSTLVEQPASKIPKALLAGANVIAGRVVEVFYKKLTTSVLPSVARDADGSRNCDFLNDIVTNAETEGARQRAEDVQDDRWLFLLLRQTTPSSSSRPPPHSSNVICVDDYVSGLLQIALGYYTTAALIQSDTPPMWKKIWDVWVNLAKGASLPNSYNANGADDQPPHEAQIAIENLIRIALLKNNIRRASELQLRLVQSYLNPNRIVLVETSFLSSKKREKTYIPTTIAECFGDSVTKELPLNKDKVTEKLMLAEKARSTLQISRLYYEEEMRKLKGDHNSAKMSSDLMLYQVLCVETVLAEDDAKVQQEANEMYRRSTTGISLADCVEICRTSMEISSCNSSGKSGFEQATILRDMTITAWNSAAASIDSETELDFLTSLGNIQSVHLCFHWVNQSILRLKNRAEIISRKKSHYFEPWNELLEFILPILKEVECQITKFTSMLSVKDDIQQRMPVIMMWLNQSLGENSAEYNDWSRCALLKLIDVVFSLLPNVLWMLSGDESRTIPHLDQEMKLAADVLSGLMLWEERAELQRQRSEKEAPTLGSKQSQGASRKSEWQHAKVSAMCFICQGSPSDIYQITNDSISSSKKKKTGGFLSFLRCMVAWSGWFQNPWPYCTNLGDARRLVANAELDLGRDLTTLEEILLQIAKADAELLNGGFIQEANELYISVLAKLQCNECSIDKNSTLLLQAHCCNGLTRIQHADQQYTDPNDANVSYTTNSLNILENLDLPPEIPPLSIWNMRSIFSASKVHELSVTRQLIADSLIHFGRFEEAQFFLQKAVADSPSDPNAALALGAFLLRLTIYIHKERNTDKEKEAQIQLLKAAKLDPSKSNPFALLGVWYEENRDLKRALKCFAKSLTLDACNPIAGRGMMRLSRDGANRDVFDLAINRSSPLNGWAWRAVGLRKAYNDGDDALAVVAILKALRCRDIALPEKESLGLFYNTPSSVMANEKSIALAEVGMCYRRLGRMTASVRAFRASIEAAGVNSTQSTTLISCAQVEQELGLFDEAAEKFAIVIDREETHGRSVALYGHAVALFSIAERDLTDGKAGVAFARLQLAIDNCQRSSILSGCELKLLGDLYSFGALFPTDIFCDEKTQNHDLNLCVINQLEFISKGEDAFRSSLITRSDCSDTDDEGIAIKSSILCDIASNILLQCQLLSSQGNDIKKVSDTYNLAEEAFRHAIEFNPIHAASWCGLGCSVLKTDPLLAQHAFSRCVQIENTFPDAYANVGFLYTSKLAFHASRSTMEALTQVADTPMMWMNCALILEREAERSLKGDHVGRPEDFISQAADAYRASLQVMRNPEAQLGLSLTSRVLLSHNETNDDNASSSVFALKRKDSYSFMKEYVAASSHDTVISSIFQCVMSMEKGIMGPPHAMWQSQIYTEGKEKIRLVQTSQSVVGKSFSDPLSQRLAASAKNLTENEKKKKETLPLPATENLQREMLLHPDRADLWLSLAKLFIENDAIESARTAASRAVDILSLELMASSQSLGKNLQHVDANMISEALSLRCWLHETQKKAVASCDMQLALLMDPTNLVARRGLLLEAKAGSTCSQ